MRARLRQRYVTAWLLALAITAVAAPSASAAGFEWEHAFSAGGVPGEIATDGAGRVYVPLRGQGKVALYDNARRGNHFVRNIGQGILVDPYAAAIDDREDLYVADRGLNAVVVFDAQVANTGNYRVNGSLGGALTQFNEPRGVTVDSLTRAYVVEAGNKRVQILEVAGTELREAFAFGLIDPPISMSNPDGIALDRQGRYYVSDASGGGVVGMYEPNGAPIGPLIGSGPNPGQVNSPRGLETDQVDRLLVADGGNNRIALFNSFNAGAGHLATFGSFGAGVNQFNLPTSLSLAPGAMLYVSDENNQRIARLRFDDADHDNAVDAIDVCPGVYDPRQLDHDGDKAGNECDSDDDGDGIPDLTDPCPITLPVNDANRDGCNDPVSAASSPARASTFRARTPSRIAGTAKADVLGVKRVWVAVARREGNSCRWLKPRSGKLVRGSCKRPRYFLASGTKRWRASLHGAELPAGKYRVYTRAQQKRSGRLERGQRVKTSFRIFR